MNDTTNQLSQIQVAAYLKAHPDFLAEHPELLGITQTAEEDVVIDFRDAQLNKARQIIERMREEKEILQQHSHDSLTVLARCEDALIPLLQAGELAELIAVITQKWPSVLGLRWCFIAFETKRENISNLKMPGLYRLSTGSIARVMQDKDLLLTETALVESMVFGKIAAKSGSTCLLRLGFPQGFEAILGFGSSKNPFFDQTPGSRILRFLGHSAEVSITKCLPQFIPQKNHPKPLIA